MAYRMCSHFGPPCQDIKRNKGWRCFCDLREWKSINAQGTQIHSPSLYYISEGNSAVYEPEYILTSIGNGNEDVMSWYSLLR